MAIIAYLDAATIEWDNGGDGVSWTDDMNWTGDIAPTASDDALIDGFTVSLGSSTTVQRVYLGGSAILTIDPSAILTVSGFTGNDEGVEVQGSATLINNGTIAISNIEGGAKANGYYSKGTTNNNGLITIDGVGQHGLYVVAGTFTNTSTGSITVTNVGTVQGDGDNIYVDDANTGTLFGTLVNEGAITVTMTTGDDGVHVNDATTLINNAMITISGTGSSDNGLKVDDNGVFNNNIGSVLTINSTIDDQIFLENTGLLNNSGTMNLNNSQDVSLYVTDDGVFTNNSSGQVNIMSSSNYSIQIDANSKTAEIINHGTITVTGGNTDGVRLQENGLFTNNASGTLSITNTGDAGIQIDDTATPISTFNNSGLVSISATSSHGLEAFGTFNNLNGGTYQSTAAGSDGVRLRNAGIFNNDGAIDIDGSASEDIETDNSTFNNTANATFTPGSSPGDLEIKDDFDLGASTITFEINGLSPTTQYDQIINTSSANTINLSTSKAILDWGSYVPVIGDKFQIIDGSGMTAGSFASVTSSNSTLVYTVTNLGTEIEVEITGILPVELVSFNGKNTARGNQLSWQTATEINNDGFDIERSDNGFDWSRIGNVRGQGDSNSNVDYRYLDNAPLNGTSYYRLKQNDLDGNFDYSNTVSVEFRNEKNEITLYPNPVKDVLYIDMNSELENVEIQLFDSNGKTLWINKGSVTQIPFGEYSPGIYFLEIVSPLSRTVQKIVK